MGLVTSRTKVRAQSVEVLDLGEDGLGKMESAAIKLGRGIPGFECGSHGCLVVSHHLRRVEVWVVKFDDVHDLQVELESARRHDDCEEDDCVAVVVGDDVENLSRPHVEDGTLAWYNLESGIHGEGRAEVDGGLDSSFVDQNESDGRITAI